MIVGPVVPGVEGEVSWGMVAVTVRGLSAAIAASIDVPPWEPGGRAR